MPELFSPIKLNTGTPAYYQPAVSLIMPFEPKMSAKGLLLQQLQSAALKIEKEIKDKFNNEFGRLVIQKLNIIINSVNFNTHKKSIAIFVSPLFEKILYLDIDVQENIHVDVSFEIRDLVIAKKDIHEYLVLVMGTRASRVFLGNGQSFTNLQSNVPDYRTGIQGDSNFKKESPSRHPEEREISLKKFINQIDIGLQWIIKAYPLPVFVMGSKKTTECFRTMTRNEQRIVGYVQGNYEEAAAAELKNVLQPFVLDWKKVKMEDLKHRLENAGKMGKLATGMEAVWKGAAKRNGKLLVVERNYSCGFMSFPCSAPEEVTATAYNPYSYVKDAIDHMIEKVLEEGGDVEFVDEGILNDYQHIALVQQY